MSSTSDLHQDWIEFLEYLNSHGVRYLVVGGFAVAFHGRPRLTAHIDFFVANDASNAESLHQALEEFGFGSAVEGPHVFVDSDKTFMLGEKPYRIDVLTKISGVDFEEAWSRRVPGKLGTTDASFISFDDLIRNKTASGRTQDKADVEKLIGVRNRRR